MNTESLNGFSAMLRPEDVASLLGVSWERLRFLLYRLPPSRRYRRFELRKRGGGVRILYAPIPELKDLQQRLLRVIEPYLAIKPCVHGFAKQRSIVSNAKGHVGARVLLNIDLSDFFPSIHIGRVIGLFRSKPFECPHSTATVFAQICCFDGNRQHFGYKRVLVDTPIVAGTSGGPVLNMDGEVVGVVAWGVRMLEDADRLESGFIPVGHLNEVVKSQTD